MATRKVRIDLSRDLPERASKLSADELSQVFGGSPPPCRGEFVACDQNWQCCSQKCRRAWFVAGQWTWECLPTWATAP